MRTLNDKSIISEVKQRKITFSHRKDPTQFTEHHFAADYMKDYSKERLEKILKQEAEVSPYQRKTMVHVIAQDICQFIENNKNASEVELAQYMKGSFNKFWKSHAQQMLEIINTPAHLKMLSSFALWAITKEPIEKNATINSILFPGVTNIDEALSFYKMYEENKTQFEPFNLVFIESKYAQGFYLADNIIDVANDVVKYSKLVDHSGEDVPRNARNLAEKLMKNEHTIKVVRPFLDEEIQLKNKYGEPSKQISQEAMTKLFNLAVSGSTYDAEKPDMSGDVTQTDDRALVELLEFLNKLKKENESSWYSLTRFQSTGSPGNLHSRLPSLLNAGDCLGSYKRDLAKFLYENSNLDLKSKAQLLTRYHDGKNNSTAWTEGSLELERPVLEKEIFTGIIRDEIEEDLGKKSIPRNSIREVMGQLNGESSINKSSLYKERLFSLKRSSEKEEPVNQSSCKC